MLGYNNRLKAAALIGVAALFAGCSSSDNAEQSVAVLGSDVSGDQIPESVGSNEFLAEDSARFLGDYDGQSYFVARTAAAPEYEVSLGEFDADTAEVVSACSDPLPGHEDRIVVLGHMHPGPGVALGHANKLTMFSAFVCA